MSARFLFAALILASGAAAPAWAQEEDLPLDPPPLAVDAAPQSRSARLERLYASLASAKTPEDAKRFEVSIDQIWSQSGSATADLLAERAVELVSGDDQAGALKLLHEALEVKPDYAEGWNKRATLFFLRGDYVSAMSSLREVLRYEPRHYGAWAGLGKILQQTGDEKRALDAYRRALAIHPHLDGLREDADRLADKLRGEML